MSTTSLSPVYLPEERQAVQAELDRLLLDKRFSGAPQMSAFLRYIVTETLAGKSDRIKAYSVGVDALGKPPTFDAQNDPSVRVLALRLRKTLNLIYSTAIGHHAIIELKVGTYVPEFFPVSKNTETSETPMSKDSSVLGHADQIAPVKVGLVNVERRGDSRDNTRIIVDKDIDAIQVAQPSPELKKGKELLGGKKPSSSMKTPTVLTLALVSALTFWHGFSGSSNAVLLATSDSPQTGKLVADITANQNTAIGASRLSTGQALDMPTLYLSHPDQQTQYEQDLSVLIATSLMESGSFNVMRPMQIASYSSFSAGSYQVLVKEFQVDDDSRVDVQLINLRSSEIVFASTLSSSEEGNSVGAELLSSIGFFTADLSDRAGSLYRDFCNSNSVASVASCSGEGADET